MPENSDMEEVKKKLDGLLGIVQQKKEESQSSGTPWGWITAAIAAILAFVGLAFAAYDAWKKGRELAKLKHEADAMEEARIQAEIAAKLSTEDQIQRSQSLAAEQFSKQVEQLKEQIRSIEQERKDLHSKIDKVTSWVDVDNLK